MVLKYILPSQFPHTLLVRLRRSIPGLLFEAAQLIDICISYSIFVT